MDARRANFSGVLYSVRSSFLCRACASVPWKLGSCVGVYQRANSVRSFRQRLCQRRGLWICCLAGLCAGESKVRGAQSNPHETKRSGSAQQETKIKLYKTVTLLTRRFTLYCLKRFPLSHKTLL